MTSELWFGQDEFQHIHTVVSKNQPKYIGLKFTAVKKRDTDLTALSIGSNEYNVRTVRYWRQKPRKPKPTFKSTPVKFHVHFRSFNFSPPCSLSQKANLHSTHQQALWLPVVFYQCVLPMRSPNRRLKGGRRVRSEYLSSWFLPMRSPWAPGALQLKFITHLKESVLPSCLIWVPEPLLPLFSSGLGLVTTKLLPVPGSSTPFPHPHLLQLTSLQINPTQIILIWAKYLFPVRTLMIKG